MSNGTNTNAPDLCHWVTPVEGELTRFRVESRQINAGSYMVDLESYDGNGACGCPHFEFRYRGKLEAGHPPGPFTRCWHIEMAGAYLLQRTIAKLVEIQKGRKPAWAAWYE